MTHTFVEYYDKWSYSGASFTNDNDSLRGYATVSTIDDSGAGAIIGVYFSTITAWTEQHEYVENGNVLAASSVALGAGSGTSMGPPMTDHYKYLSFSNSAWLAPASSPVGQNTTVALEFEEKTASSAVPALTGAMGQTALH